jgi:hypothetical protein
MSVVGEKYIYVIGGGDAAVYSGDVYSFDIGTK